MSDDSFLDSYWEAPIDRRALLARAAVASGARGPPRRACGPGAAAPGAHPGGHTR
jgi:hypothetical protein